MEVQLKGRKAVTKYPKTLETLLKFGFIFVDVYENPRVVLKKDTLDNTIKEFMVELNVSVNKDDGS